MSSSYTTDHALGRGGTDHRNREPYPLGEGALSESLAAEGYGQLHSSDERESRLLPYLLSPACLLLPFSTFL